MPVPGYFVVMGFGLLFGLFMYFREPPRRIAYQPSRPEPAEYSNTYDTHPNRDKGNNVNDCPICQENLNDGSAIKKLPCEHVYHEACIEHWFKERRLCPICRKYA